MFLKELLSLIVIFFLSWVLILPADTKLEKIDRFCAPINWFGNVSVSVSALISDKYPDKVDYAFKKFNYGCRYTIWRLFYEDQYNKENKLIKPEKQMIDSSAPLASAPVSNKPAPASAAK